MRAPWRLATNSLLQRPSRSALLSASVALCAALIVAIACAMSSVTRAVEVRIEETVGASDARIDRRAAAERLFDERLVAVVDAYPGVKLAVPRLVGAMQLRGPGAGEFDLSKPPTTAAPALSRVTTGAAPKGATSGVPTGAGRATIIGVQTQREFALRPLRIVEGATIPDGRAGDNTIVLEQRLAELLAAKVGQQVWVRGQGTALLLRVVGLARQPALSVVFDQHQAYVNLATAQALEGAEAKISQVDVVLREGVDAAQWDKETRGRFDAAAGVAGSDEAGLHVNLSARITAGLGQQVQGQQIGFVIASVLSFLAASFIITTAMTTNVTERTRELAVLRCIGATRWQLAASQLWVGVIVGGLGGALGTPIGVIGAAVLVSLFPDQLPGGFAMSWLGVAMALGGSIGAGLIGGVWPALAATRVSPLEGLSVRARPVQGRWMVLCAVLGPALMATHATIVALSFDPDVKFWVYVLVGIPSIVAGYFLLSVPLTAMVARVVAPVLSWVFGLPRSMLSRTIQATPFRHGFTAGAMMLGLALMVSIWTNGRSVMEDWLVKMEIPDAFAVGIGFTPRTLEAVRGVEGVGNATPISLLTVKLPDQQSMGVAGVQRYLTSFIGFEPDAFFAMTAIRWTLPETPEGIARAKRRLNEGGAILVAREFMTTRGIKPGDTVNVEYAGKKEPFEVVGVVSSPGLDIVSKFFSIGETVGENAVNAVFGTRADLRAKFNYSGWNLAQIAFTPEVREAGEATARGERVAPGARTPEATLEEVRSLMGFGVREVGSSIEIKQRILEVMGGALIVASAVAMAAMMVTCFAVANLIVAGVQARRFEFGVLRAVGAQRGLLGRLVIGEALVIAISASLLGVGMGVQGAWGGQTLNALVIGIELMVRPPLLPIAVGCLAVVLITVGASWPTARALTQLHPRQLLGGMKG
jgi:putative ABC transport system permease protein